jgi:flagellar hook-associated protein 1 FlgK
MGMQGLSIATSGLRVAHANLGVTGHNMSNAEIRGFSRQRIVQNDSNIVRKLGKNPAGGENVIGLGVDRQAVTQLRNEFLDFTYRQSVGRLTFYSTITTVGREIEGMLGEMYGAYNFQSVINDMWFAIQELTRHPDGFATRQLLLSTAQSFLNKANEVYQGLVQEQINLNQQVISAVDEINGLISRISELNDIIRAGEQAGDNANDFRDARNLALDQLAELIPTDIRIDGNGNVNITSMGHELLNGGVQTTMGLRFISSDFDFVIPVLGTGGQTLPANSPPDSFVSYMHMHPINNANNNDFGKLHALLLARGMAPANYISNQVQHPQARLDAFRALEAASPPGSGWDSYVADYVENMDAYIFNYHFHQWSIEHAMIPRVQQNLDNIVNTMVRMLNDAVSGQLRELNPEYPTSRIPITIPRHPNYDLLEGGRYRFVFRCDDSTLDGYPWNHQITWDIGNPPTQGGTPIFVRNPRHTSQLPGQGIDPNDRNTIYSIENLIINPDLLQPGGHNLIALSLERDAVNDTRVLQGLQEVWRSNTGPYVVEIAGSSFRVQEAYVRMVNQISVDVNEAMRFTEAQSIQVIQADQRRLAVKGVSMDEELASMLRFQYAFQAASRVINIIDGMIGILVNIGRN